MTMNCLESVLADIRHYYEHIILEDERINFYLFSVENAKKIKNKKIKTKSRVVIRTLAIIILQNKDSIFLLAAT